MSFNLIQALSLTNLNSNEIETINTKCQNKETLTTTLPGNPYLLELILTHLPDNLSTVDSPLLFSIVCNENLHTTLSANLLCKIAQVRDEVFSIMLRENLEFAFTPIAKKFNSGIPNILGIKFEIKTVIARNLEKHPEIPFNLHITIAHDLVNQHFGEKVSAKIFPEKKIIINECLENLFNAAMTIQTQAKTDSPKGSTTLLTFLSSLPKTEQQEAKPYLEKQLAAKLKSLSKHAPSIHPLKIPAFSAFYNEVRKTISLIKDLDVAKSSQSAIESLIEEFFPKIVGLFKIAKDASKGVKTEQMIARYCLVLSQKTILSISEVAPTARNKIEGLLFQVLTSHFNTDDWDLLENSDCFDENTRCVIKVISLLHKFLEEKTTSLQSFTNCLDDVYLLLLPIQNNLKESNKEEILLDVFLSLLRGMLSKAGSKYQEDISKSPSIIDLNLTNNAKMVKRLKQYFVAFNEWFTGEIEIQVEMKIANDVLITMLFQLISQRFPATTPAYISTIREWIDKNPTYHFKEFQGWLQQKIAVKEKLTIKKDPEYIYNVFMKHQILQIPKALTSDEIKLFS